jgi:hypothetical protein
MQALKLCLHNLLYSLFSKDSKYDPIELSGDEINGLAVVGVFVCVL